MTESKWVFGIPNSRLNGEGYAISYNPYEGETALWYKNHCLILNGDWRKQYEEVFDKGADACYNEVFLKYKDQHENLYWSEHCYLLRKGETYE